MELNLQRRNIKNVTIEGHDFKIDCNKVDTIIAFDKFMEKQKAATAITHQTVVGDCKELLEVVCPGMWETLFTDDEGSLAPYYLCLDLKDIVHGEFLKDVREEQAKEDEDALRSIEKLSASMTNLSNAMEKANQKYGGTNVMVNNRRSSNKRHKR